MPAPVPARPLKDRTKQPAPQSLDPRIKRRPRGLRKPSETVRPFGLGWAGVAEMVQAGPRSCAAVAAPAAARGAPGRSGWSLSRPSRADQSFTRWRCRPGCPVSALVVACETVRCCPSGSGLLAALLAARPGLVLAVLVLASFLHRRGRVTLPGVHPLAIGQRVRTGARAGQMTGLLSSVQRYITSVWVRVRCRKRRS